jgi:hypothetical protein
MNLGLTPQATLCRAFGAAAPDTAGYEEKKPHGAPLEKLENAGGAPE